MLIFIVLLLAIIIIILGSVSNEKVGKGYTGDFDWLANFDWFTSPPLITFDDLKVIPDMKHVNSFTNCHLGQRKLLLNEILFYTKYLPDKPSTIIYSGSASGEHTPSILEMFPKARIIMIDPFFHLMTYDYVYIYKKGHGNKKDIEIMINKKDKRSSTITNYVNMLKTKKCLDGEVYDAWDTEDFGSIENINMINSYDAKVFVIQDYMSKELAELLKGYGDIYISDIRTVWFNDYMGSPTAIDILHNSALQLNVFHIFEIPCHLKFVMPSFRDEDTSVKRINELPPL